jgi:hypothetical protein
MRALSSLLLLATLTLGTGGLRAQDPSLREALVVGKSLWKDQGDREGALGKIEQILTALEPRAKELNPEWMGVLCEAHFWMAVLEDRLPARRGAATKHLEALVDLEPNFDVEGGFPNSRLQTAFDALRNGRLGKVQLRLTPEGGVLQVDGRKVPPAPGARFFRPGDHTFSYTRPGFKPLERVVALEVREAKTLELALERVAATVTFSVSPPVVKVSLDGKAIGQTRAGGAAREVADRLGVPPDQVSAEFLVDGLGAGEHFVELSAPCYRPKLIKIPAAFTTPFSDTPLDPVRLERSEGKLTVTALVPRGEVFLSGRSLGPLPLQAVSVCAGTYDLRVDFPEGGYSQKLELPEGKAVSVVAQPRPRLAYLGLLGSDDFTGRERLLAQLTQLGERLKGVAFLPQDREEKVEDALARLRLSKSAELVFYARAVAEKPIRHVELVVATLRGEESRWLVKPLDQDPLGAVVERLNRPAPIWERDAGVALLDVAGMPGPWVLEASESARAAGLKEGQPLLPEGGATFRTVAEFRALLRASGADRVAVNQGGVTITLPVRAAALELPLQDDGLCYPFLLVDLRLRRSTASGDEAGFLRMQEALVLMHFRQYDKALEVLRDAKVSVTQGVSQGTLEYYAGLCLLHLGQAFLPDARQAFTTASRHPQATLLGPGGPRVAPLARQLLDDIRP